MSHSLQSAECQTVFSVLPPRPSRASAPEALPSVLTVSNTRCLPKPPVRIKPEETRPLRIGVFGRGRLGSAVVECSRESKDLTLAWALGRGYAPRSPVDVVLDASHGEAVRGHIEWAVRTGADLVIGATGWKIPDLADIVGERIGVLTAPNFSLGAALLRRFSLVLGRFAASYPEADLGISEKHHRNKTDAPSGTAVTLAAALVRGCPRYSGWTLGSAAPGKLSVSSLRTGYEIGCHEVLLDAPAETIALSHSARSRDLFARGALEALRWIRGRKGLFTFDDMAAELIDPLFRFEPETEEADR